MEQIFLEGLSKDSTLPTFRLWTSDLHIETQYIYVVLSHPGSDTL